MDKLLESYGEFISEGVVKFKHFGVNFTVTAKIVASERVAKYQFIPSTSKDLDMLKDRSNIAKTIELFLRKKTGLSYKFNPSDDAAGLAFTTYISDLEDVMLKAVQK